MSTKGLNPGGYVFISHSHQDILKVRQIRNAMEEAGFEPLCFYLKCLSDEDEIEGLLKREIDAREWFVYIDSPNARASSWVAREREYIESLTGKQVVTIDLDSVRDMSEVAAKLIRGLRVLIVCGKADEAIGEELRQCFIDKDMQTFLSVDDVREEDAGAVVLLLSRNGLGREQAAQAVARARESGANITAVVIDGYDIRPLEDLLDGKDGRVVYSLGRSDGRMRLEELVRHVEADTTHDFRKAFAEARSHSEVESYYLQNMDDPEAERLAAEAQERLDEEERIKEDLRESVERGTMKLTEELRKYLGL